MMTNKRWTEFFCKLSLSFLLVVMVFNLIIDPFAFFSLVSIKNINEHKYHKRSRFVGSYNISYRQYDTLIVGSSRSRSGIRTDNPNFAGERVYNYSLPKVVFSETFWVLQHALVRQHNLRHVIIALDYSSFPHAGTIRNQQYHAMFDPRNTKFTVLAKSLLTYSTTKESVKTLTRNISGNPKGRFVNGYFVSERDIPDMMRDLYNRVDHFMINKRQCRKKLANDEYESSYLAFKKMLVLLAQHEIKVTVIINPVHAMRHAASYYLGVWPHYLSWLDNISRVVFSVNQDYHDRIRLWNFSGFNKITSEPFPELNQPMTYYYEISHYKPVTGDYMLDKIHGKPAPFGVELTPLNYKQEIAKLELERQAYYQTHRSEIDKLHSMLAPLKKRLDKICRQLAEQNKQA